MSSAYHPQTDGQTERTNQTLEQYLRCYVNYEQENWVSLLPTAQFAFNNAPGPTGVSPFYANFGKHPEIARDPRQLKPVAEKAQVSVEHIRTMHQLLAEDLKEIRKTSMKSTNKKRSEGPALEKGGMVYLLRRNIKTKRPSDKLDHTKLGPFKIRDKLGPVTYRLELPKKMRIHPVFHVSLLEPAPKGLKKQENVELDEDTQTPNREPETAVGHKFINNVPYYLIHWKNTESAEDTWEPQGLLTQQIIADYHQSHQSPREQRNRHRRQETGNRP